jgi:hypothetical protein
MHERPNGDEQTEDLDAKVCHRVTGELNEPLPKVHAHLNRPGVSPGLARQYSPAPPQRGRARRGRAVVVTWAPSVNDGPPAEAHRASGPQRGDGVRSWACGAVNAAG